MNDVFRRNLAQLPAFVGERVTEAPHRDEVIVGVARDGEFLLGIRQENRDVFFHSRYAPLREAERIAATVPAGAFVVALGFGAGHHVRALLEAGHRVVAVEPNSSILRAALEHFDFADAFATQALSVAVGSPDEVEQIVRECFVPGLDERLVTVDLPGRVSVDQEEFAPYRSGVARLMSDYAGDIATQAAFGKRWMRQTLANLVNLASSDAALSTLRSVKGATVCVAAAGPSLESQIDWISRRRAKVVLFAVDTALPILCAHGVTPDLVVSIDCQLTSYHHYLSAAPVTVPAAIEVSAPGALLEAVGHVVPIGSSHPFHRFLTAHSLPLATVATGSGTVTGATVALARSLDAGTILLAGVDSSYPRGELYPRGSYAHRYFYCRSTRVTPVEGSMRGFLWTRGELERDGTRWITPKLRSYHDHLRRSLSVIQTPVYELAGDGLPLGFPLPDKELLYRPAPKLVQTEQPLDRRRLQAVLDHFLRLVASVTDRESLTRSLSHAKSHHAAASILPVLLAVSKEDPGIAHDERIHIAANWVRDQVAQAVDDLGS